jgi:hypothetical protein
LRLALAVIRVPFPLVSKPAAVSSEDTRQLG